MVSTAAGTKEQVKFESLKPVGTLRVQRTLPRLHKVDVGQFVIYEEEEQSFGGSSGNEMLLRVTWGRWVVLSDGQSNICYLK